VISVGGDFMEFRSLMPVLPLAMILVVAVLESIRPRAVAGILSALMIAASFWHGATFRGIVGIESVKGLESHVDGDDDWLGVGRELGRLFAGDSVVIAVTAAGAIPYASRLPSVDMLGLCDPWVARHGALVHGARAGHRRIATHAYLHARGVHLVLGHPLVVAPDSTLRERYTIADLSELGILDVDSALLPASAAVVEIPVDGRTLCVLALEPSAAVDRVIRARGLVTRPIVRARPEQPPRSSAIRHSPPSGAS
jgi:hypothetical protein